MDLIKNNPVTLKINADWRIVPTTTGDLVHKVRLKRGEVSHKELYVSQNEVVLGYVEKRPGVPVWSDAKCREIAFTPSTVTAMVILEARSTWDEKNLFDENNVHDPCRRTFINLDDARAWVEHTVSSLIYGLLDEN